MVVACDFLCDGNLSLQALSSSESSYSNVGIHWLKLYSSCFHGICKHMCFKIIFMLISLIFMVYASFQIYRWCISFL